MNTQVKHSCPPHIRPEHWHEWVIESGVDPGIVALNVRSLTDIEINPHTNEVAATPIHDLLNWDYVRFGQQVKPGLRGWAVSGVEGWARFKPDRDTPVMDWQKNQPAKYLSPKGQPSRLILLAVPRHIWERVSQRWGIPITPQDTDFWQWVKRHNVPRFVIEGEKKAGYLLTLGYAAIALPGITGGTRTRDEQGNYCAAYLIPDLEEFATPDAQFYIGFDYETRLKQKRQMSKEKQKLSRAIVQKTGITPKDVHLPGPEKGFDDFGVARGAGAVHQVIKEAQTLTEWKLWEYSRFSYPANLRLNQRYLGDLPIPQDAKLVAIRSPKGTGKTECYKAIAQRFNDNGLRVLSLVHRTQLGQAICDRIGIAFLSEVHALEERDLLGYGLCVDSAHGDSQARFNPNEWGNSLLILDEWDQILWHLLNSKTEVSKHRIEILANLKQLFINILESEHGQIIISDADLTNTSLQFIQDLTGIRLKPWVVVNDWQPGAEESWNVFHYEHRNPYPWLEALINEIHEGGKVFIATHSQKADKLWSSHNMEALMRRLFPDKTVLRVDGVTIRDPEHEAYGCVSNLNEVLPRYDIVITTPAIETGVSIDVKGHFSSVWGCLQGVTSTNSARQSLARVREPVPRHVWIARQGLSEVGNGSNSLASLYSSQKQLGKKNFWLNQLDQTLLDEDDTSFISLVALRTWAKIASCMNHGRKNYRAAILDGLADEGHTIIEMEPQEVDGYLPELLRQIRDDQHQEQCEKTANAPLITPNQYEELSAKKTKTSEEWHKEQKFFLHQRYQIPVTPELVAKNDDGWYPKIRLAYYLTLGKKFLQARDRQKAEAELYQGQVWLPSYNDSQLGIQVGFLEMFGIKDLMNPDKEWKGGNKADGYATASPELLRLKAFAQAHSWEIKAALGITVPLDKPDNPIAPIQIAKLLLGKLGVTLSYLGRFGARGDRQRCYRFVPPEDGRNEVFDKWVERDQARLDAAVSTPLIDSNNGAWTQEGVA